MPQPRCDFYGKKRCRNKAYAEAYWKKGDWSYLCKNHFGKKRREMRYWGILDEWWIADQFMLAIRRIENKFGICQPKNGKWCLAVEFNDEIDKLAQEVLKSVGKYRIK